MARAIVTVPPSVARGEVFEVRAIIAHPMETGFRPGPDGQRLPRDVLRRFTCRYDGAVVFSADLYPAVAANPYLAFHALATVSGPMSFTWEGDNGFAQTETAAIIVT